MKIDTLLLATVPWMCLSQNRLFIKDANLISWSFISCAYFCDASSFLILNLAAFGVFSFFFPLFSFGNLCSNILWCSMSHSVCVGKGWFIAGSIPESGGERVECICVFYVFVVEMHKTFFFSFFPLFIISSVWVNIPANPLGTYRDFWYAHSFISAQSHRY